MQRADQQHRRDGQEQDDNRSARPAVLAPITLALVLIGGTAWYSFSQISDARPAPVPTPETLRHPGAPAAPRDHSRGQDAMPADAWRGSTSHTGNPVQNLLHEADQHQRMLLHPGDQLLVTEPANLQPPPGSTRVAGFSRPLEGWQEDVTIHRLTDTTPQGIIDHYRQQAHEAGFELATGLQEPDISRAVWSRPAATASEKNTEMLSVRARRDAAGVTRVVVWLRRPAR